VRSGVIGLGTAAQAVHLPPVGRHRVTEGRPPAAGIAEGRADVLTCQRVVGALVTGRGRALGGEAAVA
jgi:hypothetical protein